MQLVRVGPWTFNTLWLIRIRENPPGVDPPIAARVSMFPGDECDLTRDEADQLFRELGLKKGGSSRPLLSEGAPLKTPKPSAGTQATPPRAQRRGRSARASAHHRKLSFPVSARGEGARR